MSIRFYDLAVVDKIKSWALNTNINIYSPNESKRMFEMMADSNNDKPIELPIVAISRPYGYTIADNTKKPRSYSGYTLDQTPEKSLLVSSILVSLRYLLDVYTRKYEEADELIRNFIFNLINFPSLTVKIPYHDVGFEHKSVISLQPNVSDNSGISERAISGLFTRLTLEFEILDAHIWDIRVQKNSKIASIEINTEDNYNDGKGIIIRENDET